MGLKGVVWIIQVDTSHMKREGRRATLDKDRIFLLVQHHVEIFRIRGNKAGLVS